MTNAAGGKRAEDYNRRNKVEKLTKIILDRKNPGASTVTHPA
jgi:hypothetical protein